MSKTQLVSPQRFSNLYRFIRLILGEKIPDSRIARLWKMDVKNFYDFKIGRYPIPRVERLLALANILKVNEHIVFEVVRGTSAQRVYHFLNKLHLKRTKYITSQKIFRLHKTMEESERRYQKLFHNINEAVFLADTKTNILIDCNKKAEQLIRRTREEIVGMHFIKLHPPAEHTYYRGFFKGHVRKRIVTEFKPAEVIRKDGKIIPVLISARVFELDGRKVIQGVFRDISKLKLAR